MPTWRIGGHNSGRRSVMIDSQTGAAIEPVLESPLVSHGESVKEVKADINMSVQEGVSTMAYKLIDLPVGLDDAPKVLLGYFTGTVTDYWEIAHAAVHMQGFAVGQFHTHQASSSSDTDKPRVLSDEEFKTFLESCCNESEGVKAYGAVDWKSILMTITQLLLKLVLEQ